MALFLLMRRVAAVAALLALCMATTRPAAEPQVDRVARFLVDLDLAVETGRVAALATGLGPRLSAGDVAGLSRLTLDGAAASVSIIERARTASSVVAEIFVASGQDGRLSIWQFDFVPSTPPTAIELVKAVELAAIGDLIRLVLDDTRQFTVRNLRVTAQDLTVTMASGVAFVSSVAAGTTALVLRGRAAVRFSPPDAAEQGQLRIFVDQSPLILDADELFVRMNPGEIDRWVAEGILEPAVVRAGAAAQAREIFERQAGQSYHLDLHPFSADRWSIAPEAGSLLVDFRAGHRGWLTYTLTPSNQEDVALFDRSRRKQISQYASPDRQLARRDREGPYDVLHTAVDVTFDPVRRWLSGRASLRMSLSGVASSFNVKLANSLVVSSVSSPELGTLLPLRVSGQGSFVVSLPENERQPQAITLDVQYHGRLEPQTLNRDTLVVGAAEERSDSVLPIEPRFLYSTGVAWYPQAESRRHAPASIRVTVPAEYHVLATGRLEDEVVSASVGLTPTMGRTVRTLHYRADTPVPYLAFLATRLTAAGRATARVAVNSGGRSEPSSVAGRGQMSGDATRDRGGESAVAVDVWAATRQAGRRRVTAERVASIIAFYAGILGEAPYPSMTVASLEDALPGAHSPAYFALINQPHPASALTWRDDPVAFEETPDYQIAHEVAHQWWGQAVGPKDYHEQWISEGFAQYFAWLYLASTVSPDVARRMMVRMRATAEDASDGGPIYLGYRIGHLENRSRVFRAVVYNKTAVVLHMLRRIIGDEAFFGGVRRLYEARRFQTAEYHDVVEAFEGEARMPLERFFRRWIREAEVPRIRAAWRTDADGRVVVDVRQLGATFDLPLDATVRYADGRRDQFPIVLTEPSAEFLLPTRGSVADVVIADELTIARMVR